MTAGRRLVLALDTATRRTVVALGDAEGRAIAARSHDRSGPPLLDAIEAVLRDARAAPSDLSAVVVGTGPGSFTGLRVGLATAKTLAYALGTGIVGVPTVESLAHAAAGAVAPRAPGAVVPGVTVSVVLPAGARDHYLARVEAGEGAGTPGGDPVRLIEPVRLLVPGTDLRAAVGADVTLGIEVAPDALDAEALERGRAALEALGDALLAIGAARVAAGRRDDIATLVPQYVALPRGVTDAAREMAWSPDLR